MRRIVMGGLFVAVVGFAAYLYLKPSHPKYAVYATFSDAAGILKNYNVKVGEIPAGKVIKISLDKHDNAVVEMSMSKGAYPIGVGASAKVRPVNLLGEKYIDLDPGDLKRPVPSGTMIPVTKTAEPIELDDALNSLDTSTRAGMRILINEAGLAMAGRGADFNQTLSDLPPALDKAKQLVSEAQAENAQLKSVIDSGDRNLATITPKRDDLSALINSAGSALETAAQKRAQLGATVQTAPAALAQLRTTLAKLQGTSQALIPTADDLVQTAPSLKTTLDRLPAFAGDADKTLARVKSVSPMLGKLGRRSTPTLQVLKPTTQHLAQFSSDLQPLVQTLDTQGKDGTTNLLNFINGWADLTSGQDNLGHVFRLRLTLDQSAITGALDRIVGPNATKKKTVAPADATPAATPAPATVPSLTTPSTSTTTTGRKPGITVIPGVTLPDPQQAVQDATNAVNGVLGGVTKPPSTATPPPSSNSDSSSSNGGDSGKLLNYLLGS